MKQTIFDLKYIIKTAPNRIKEKIEWWIAFALPRKIAYLSMMRVYAHGTSGKYGNTMVNEVTAMEILGRWETDNKETTMTPVLGCSECPPGKIPHPCNVK